MASTVIPLLTNASATPSTYTQVDGGTYIAVAEGTFGGAALALTYLSSDGSTERTASALTVGTPVTVTVGDATHMRVTVTGGSPSALYATMKRVV